MAPNTEKSQLKRARPSIGETNESKKPRRSNRLSAAHDDSKMTQQTHLPSPVTRKASTSTEDAPPRTESPPSQSDLQKASISHRQRTPESSPRPDADDSPELLGGKVRQSQNDHNMSGLSSPPSDTQPLSQFLVPPPLAYEVDDEEGEGVWGYLIPLNYNGLPSASQSEVLVLRRRAACPVPSDDVGNVSGRDRLGKDALKNQEEKYEGEKANWGTPAGGYLLGRHGECDRIINHPTVSNRHCLLFSATRNGDSIAVTEDLSGNGTYVNDALIGRNKRRELRDGDEISILDIARFVFRYPRDTDSHGFHSQYEMHGQLGKGHFATVYLCTERCSGIRFAVKKFEKRITRGPGKKEAEDKSKEGLQQEIAVLMGVSHPNMLCLKDTFDEKDGVYLVLELAPEGELFNFIVQRQKLTETETRRIFVQLFQGVKYLHERNIVHRDIKPENILLISLSDLSIKLADFGLAKIIGEESFTSTLCGTPSYVAPEILVSGNNRRYTKAVDIWSLGVVLYICLCGFPPFSDELYSPENPYTLSQQIKLGRFDYPSPYWDSVGDPALDLIDHMLTVPVDQRYNIDQCLEHPWTTGRIPGATSFISDSQKAGNGTPGVETADGSQVSVNDSLDGLRGRMEGLDFSRRKPVRERTLLSDINECRVTRVVDLGKETGAMHTGSKSDPKSGQKPGADGQGQKRENGRGKEDDDDGDEGEEDGNGGGDGDGKGDGENDGDGKPPLKIWEKNGALNVDEEALPPGREMDLSEQQRHAEMEFGLEARAGQVPGQGIGKDDGGMDSKEVAERCEGAVEAARVDREDGIEVDVGGDGDGDGDGEGEGEGEGEKEKAKRELSPSHERDPREFMQLGGKGDQPLFGDDQGSRYLDRSLRAGPPPGEGK